MSRGMKLDCTLKGKDLIDMIEYVKSMVKSFPEKNLQYTMEWSSI